MATIGKMFNSKYIEAAKKFGELYTVYRINENVEALDIANKVDQIKARVTLNTGIQGAQWSIPYWNTYCDVNRIEEGDFLSNGTDTFFILSKQPSRLS